MNKQIIGGIILFLAVIVILVVALTTKGIFSPIGATLNIAFALTGAYVFWIDPMIQSRRRDKQNG